jgi:hypothetical protein
MTNKRAKGSWSGVKTALRAADQSDLLAVIRDLYDASPDNRRFLHARFFGPGTELQKYRALILDAMYPNLFGRKPVRVGEAQRLVRHFELATGDTDRTIDLMLTLVEAGTDLAADTGHGDEAYFRALEATLSQAVTKIRSVGTAERLQWQGRLNGIVNRSAAIGWGYCDAAREIVASVDR